MKENYKLIDAQTRRQPITLLQGIQHRIWRQIINQVNGTIFFYANNILAKNQVSARSSN